MDSFENGTYFRPLIRKSLLTHVLAVMKNKITILILFNVLFTILLLFTNFTTHNNKNSSSSPKLIEIRGIYGSPEPFWKKISA